MVLTCAPSRGEIQAFSGTRYSAVLTRPRHVVAILGPGGMREASEHRAPIRIACCVCAVCGMSYLCVARRMHYMRDARRARCIYAVCWVGCLCGACQMHTVRDAHRACCVCANCGMSCARGACRMHSTRDVRRPGGFGGQLVAGRTPGYSPSIRRVYARHTPEHVSELDRERARISERAAAGPCAKKEL